MRLISKDKTLSPADLAIVHQPEKRQIVATEINEQEAKKLFKEQPWALVLITPTFYWFRHD